MKIVLKQKGKGIYSSKEQELFSLQYYYIRCVILYKVLVESCAIDDNPETYQLVMMYTRVFLKMPKSELICIPDANLADLPDEVIETRNIKSKNKGWTNTHKLNPMWRMLLNFALKLIENKNLTSVEKIIKDIIQ